LALALSACSGAEAGPPSARKPVSAPAPVDAVFTVSNASNFYDVYSLRMGDSELVHLGTSGMLQLEWSPDRARVKVVEGDGSVDIVQANGGVTRTFPAGRFGDSAWSPDGTRLAFFLDGKLFVGEADGNHAASIPFALQDESYPPLISWAPDGSKMALAYGAHWVVTGADGTNPSPVITETPAGLGNLTWAPDGRRITAQVSDPSGAMYLGNTDGSAITPVFVGSGPGVPINAVGWSPSGDWFALCTPVVPLCNGASRCDPVFAVITNGPLTFGTATESAGVPGADGATAFKLTNVSCSNVGGWSPVDDRFAYTKEDGSVNVLSPGGDSVRLAEGGQPHLSPTWSPDGKRLIYIALDGTSVLIDSRSGAEIALLRGQFRDWNATGTRFLGYSDEPPAGPFTANAEGGEQVPLEAEGATLSNEDWLPDGEHVIVSAQDFAHRQPGSEDPVSNIRIWTEGADGSDLTLWFDKKEVPGSGLLLAKPER
jgi:Tol biopolymer transport system component